MEVPMRQGDAIRVRSFGGKILIRRIVGISGTHVFVCNEAEYQSALKEEREPDAIGFRLEDVVESATLS